MEVLDLFAGSGSVGIEALSQGAGRCTFIDSGRQAVATITKNLALTGLSDRALVRHDNALRYLKESDSAFDLIYVAPPQYKNLWVEAMELIASRPELLRGVAEQPEEEQQGAGLAVVQIDPKEYATLDLESMRELRQKRYGNTLLVFFERE